MTSKAQGWAVLATAVMLTASVATSVAATPRLTGETNTSFAGYQVAKPTVHIKSAAATFVIPTITCKKNFSGVGPAVIVQSTVNKKTNTFTQTGAGIGVGCQHHQAVYESIIEVAGSFSNDLVGLAAGDKVVVEVGLTKTRTKVSFDDVTAKLKKTRTGKGAIGATALIGASALSTNNVRVPLDPFTKILITDAQINGKSLAAQKPVRLTWVRTKKGKTTVLATANKITKGRRFGVTFKHS